MRSCCPAASREKRSETPGIGHDRTTMPARSTMLEIWLGLWAQLSHTCCLCAHRPYKRVLNALPQLKECASCKWDCLKTVPAPSAPLARGTGFQRSPLQVVCAPGIQTLKCRWLARRPRGSATRRLDGLKARYCERLEVSRAGRLQGSTTWRLDNVKAQRLDRSTAQRLDRRLNGSLARRSMAPHVTIRSGRPISWTSQQLRLVTTTRHHNTAAQLCSPTSAHHGSLSAHLCSMSAHLLNERSPLLNERSPAQ